jgi:ABC-2 type transport system ATP-binding protein
MTIKFDCLTKTYKNGKGIFDLDFEVKDCQVFGYLGPNGAGKTTTIRNLLGFMTPDKGGAFIDGMDCRKEADKIQKNLGYLPGEIAFLDNMKGKDFLRFMSEMRGKNGDVRKDELLERFPFDTNTSIRKMSKGTKQKLGIVTAFMHDPQVLILDEPTSGLDPLMQNAFVELILDEKKRGKTIFMSSHVFDEVDRTCDRVGIIADGRIAAIEDIKTLKAARKRAYSVTVSDDDAPALAAGRLNIIKQKGSRFTIEIQDDYSGLFKALSSMKVLSFDNVELRLEDIFMKYYGEGK